MRHPLGLAATLTLVLLYGIAIFADFLSAYQTSDQHLEKTYHPPTPLKWHDGHLCVSVYKLVDPSAAVYQPDPGRYTPVHIMATGHPYKLFGLIPARRHLLVAEKPGVMFLMGSDSTGRDVYSRLLYGSRISLTIGLVGIAITMALGLIVGGLAGYFGGIWDNLAMRFTELLMAIPGLYLLLALRSALASRFSSDQMFLLIVVILSFIGWAGAARVIRGMSLSLRRQPFILAAEALGQSPWIILWRHLVPNLFSYLIVAATLSIPGYILGEAALSFLGIGIQEPASSWGLMLSQAQEMKVFMLNFWWLLTPGVLIFITVIAFNVLGDVLRDIVDPKLALQNRSATE